MNLDLAEPSIVKGNQEKLKSIINNLIINALEAMPTGGELTLRSSVDGDYALLHVEDTGVGMTPEFMREKLFRPFQTSKPSGLGIGLYQSKELVEQMEGELLVESAVGKGTSFKLRLKKA
jgi:signal transduction histidine kinase